MSNQITLSDLIPTIREVVSRGQEATFIPYGISMKPMLTGGRDEIILIKPKFPLKPYDLPLYVRKNGMVVLHRVIRLNNKNGKCEYIMRGDNTWEDEYGIFEEDIVAVVSRFRRNGKWISADNSIYRFYAKWWHKCFGVRKLLRWLCLFPRRAFGKLKRMFFQK